MSDLLAEVDEIMRQERLIALWKEYGNAFITFLVVLILGTALVSGYKSWNAGVKQADTKALVDLIDNPAFPADIKPDELKMRSGPKAIALLSAAGVYLEQGKTDEALTLFTAAIDNKSTPQTLKELAILARTRLQARSDPALDIEAALMPIWKNPQSPWGYHAHLEAANFFANEKQDYAKAIEHLNVIQDAPNLPQSLYDKARALAHIYTLKSKEQKKAE